jgi:chemotaxis protein MotB
MSRIEIKAAAGLWLAASLGCAARVPTAKAPEHEARPQASAPADPALIADVAQIDREGQESRQRADAIAARVDRISSQLEDALAAQTSASQANVEKGRERVKLRMTEELLFKEGSARVTRQGRHALDGVAGVLRSSAVQRIEVAGHTDGVPITRRYPDNWALSVERARRVALYLIAHGVDPRRVRLVGAADAEPLADAGDKDGRARNRRVEILVAPELPGAATAAR